jgi:hypothetical protein
VVSGDGNLWIGAVGLLAKRGRCRAKSAGTRRGARFHVDARSAPASSEAGPAPCKKKRYRRNALCRVLRLAAPPQKTRDCKPPKAARPSTIGEPTARRHLTVPPSSGHHHPSRAEILRLLLVRPTPSMPHSRSTSPQRPIVNEPQRQARKGQATQGKGEAQHRVSARCAAFGRAGRGEYASPHRMGRPAARADVPAKSARDRQGRGWMSLARGLGGTARWVRNRAWGTRGRCSWQRP